MTTIQAAAAAGTYVSIPLIHRRMGQHPLVHITRDGLPVRVGDIFSGSLDGKKDLVDDEEQPFDSHPQEKTGYVVALGMFRRMLQHRHVIMKKGKPTPNSRRNVAVNAAKCLLGVIKKEGAIEVTIQGSSITIGDGGLSPHDLLLEGLRPDGKSYALQLAIPTPIPAGPPPTLGDVSGSQGATVSAASIDQPATIPLLSSPPNPTTSFSRRPASTSSGGPTRQLSARPRAQPYTPIPRRGQAMLSGTRRLTTGSLPSRPMMGVTPSPSSTDLSTLAAPHSLSFSEVAADFLEVLSGSSGRYSPEMHHAYDLAHPAGELGAQEPAPPLSASPEPVWSPYGGHLSDNLMVSSPQSTLFSTSSPVLSPASSPDVESNYTYSSVPDPLHAFGSAASVPRSMTYPSYSAHPSDGPSYWNTGSRGCFQG